MPTSPSPDPEPSPRLLFAAVVGVGCASVLTQLTLLRELLAAFSGNELVLGIGLGIWLLMTGVGAGAGRFLVRRGRSCSSGTRSPTADPVGEASLGRPDAPRVPVPAADRRRPVSFLLFGLVVLATIAPAQVVAARVLRDIVFLRGAAVGLPGTVLASAALLAPFCLVSGALLTVVSGLLSGSGGEPGASRSYLADTLGSIAGGVLFSFVLVRRLDHFALLSVSAAMILGLAWLLARRTRHAPAAVTAFLAAAALAVLSATVDVDAWSTAHQFAGRVVCRANSPYGRLVVTVYSGQLTFHENGSPSLGTGRAERAEEAAHFALCQRPAARRVLLIGGGLAGTAREILRWKVERVTYIELDPLLLEIGRRLLPRVLDDPRLETRTDDGRRFVQRTVERFDIVLLDLPDPATLQLNRYFTAEFFAEVKRVLAPGGVVGFGLGRYQNFVGPELASVLATGHRTLAASFAQVRMIPGSRVHFLGSDGPLTLDIAARMEAHGIAAQHFNRHSLDVALAADRLADLDRAVAAPALRNRDFHPGLFFRHLQYWNSQFAVSPAAIGLGGVFAAGLAFFLFRLSPTMRSVCVAGFAASGLEVVLLLGFQSLYGALYQQVGLVVTVFMAGLALGAWSAGRLPLLRAGGAAGVVRGLGVCIALLALALPWALPALRVLAAGTASPMVGHAAIPGLTAVLAALVGAQFGVAGAAEEGDASTAAARLYSADLVGAALGALLVSALLLPLFGATAVCLLVAGLNLAACGTMPGRLR